MASATWAVPPRCLLTQRRCSTEQIIMYQVHTNIPVPEAVRKGVFGAKQKYNFADLTTIGSSLQIPLTDFRTPAKAQESLRSTLNAWRKRSGVKHTYAIASNGDSVGVWLTAVAAE